MTDQPAPTDQEPDEHVRPFAEFLQQQRRGALHGELSESLHELLQAVKDTGKAGKLGFTLTVKPATKGNAEQVVISDVVVVKAPAVERPEAIWFIDESNNLTRSDPRQPELPLREVSRPAAAEARAVSR